MLAIFIYLFLFIPCHVCAAHRCCQCPFPDCILFNVSLSLILCSHLFLIHASTLSLSHPASVSTSTDLPSSVSSFSWSTFLPITSVPLSLPALAPFMTLYHAANTLRFPFLFLPIARLVVDNYWVYPSFFFSFFFAKHAYICIHTQI